jgi:hypothetical protein
LKLYHGTAERHLPAILRDGLKPRAQRKGNWKHTVESHPGAVYLTNAYATYYAYNATDLKKKDDRLVVLEIDTSKLIPEFFAPDEDWLEQVSRKQQHENTAPIDKSMNYRTRWYRRRLLNYGLHWRDSLNGLGNCTYHYTIPAAAITRIAFIERDAYMRLVWMGDDPMINLPNYRFCGAKYRAHTARLFGDQAEDDDPFGGLRTPEEREQYETALTEVYSKGITVQVLQ